MSKTVGLLVMAFGTPSDFAEIEDYYTRIRRGRKPSSEQLAELTGRFEQIGLTPLNKITKAQGAELARQMNAENAEVNYKLYVGFQYVAPFIDDVVEQMHADGIREFVAVTMAPHYSRFSVDTYHEMAHKGAEKFGDMTIVDVKEWWKAPEFTEFWTKNILSALTDLSEAEKAKTVVILSAHSLPMALMAMENIYEQQVSDSADQIIASLPELNFAKGWQSEGAGASPEHPWLGPDVQDLTRQLYEEKGFSHFVYCPFGFVAEHLEVFYDNDFECRAVCDALHVDYRRPPMPNADSLFISAIAKTIRKELV
jgi:ferrochelatase